MAGLSTYKWKYEIMWRMQSMKNNLDRAIARRERFRRGEWHEDLSAVARHRMGELVKSTNYIFPIQYRSAFPGMLP